MKKTLFALLALSSLAMGAEQTLTLPNSKETISQTNAIGSTWEGILSTVDSLTYGAYAGGKSELVFFASSSDIIGSNTGFAMTNFTLSDNVPEPTTATLSLLALAGLAARRRRR